MRAGRVERALRFDMARGDDDGGMARGDDDGDMEPTHSLPPSIEAEIRDDMSTRTIPRFENAHQSAAVADLSNAIERNRQIADNELRQQELRHARQLETVRQEAAAKLHSRTQTLTDQNAQTAERVRQQVIAEAEAQFNRKKEGYQKEAEAQFNRKKEGYQKEVREQLQINKEGAQQTIQQLQQQAQQEAQHIVGSVMDFAEQAHRNIIIAQKIRK